MSHHLQETKISFFVPNKAEIARFALAIRNCYIVDFQIPHLPNERLRMRIGLHTGKVKVKSASSFELVIVVKIKIKTRELKISIFEKPIER